MDELRIGKVIEGSGADGTVFEGLIVGGMNLADPLPAMPGWLALKPILGSNGRPVAIKVRVTTAQFLPVMEFDSREMEITRIHYTDLESGKLRAEPGTIWLYSERALACEVGFLPTRHAASLQRAGAVEMPRTGYRSWTGSRIVREATERR